MGVAYAHLVLMQFMLNGCYNFIVLAMLRRLNFLITDFRGMFFDFSFYFSGFLGFLSQPKNFFTHIVVYFTQFNDIRKYVLKKYVYTINHKRIAINYFIFSM